MPLMNAAKLHQKAVESAWIAFLAGAIGGRFESVPEDEEWPDGRIEGVPVEVVQAFEPVPGEKAKKGSATKRAKVEAERMATRSRVVPASPPRLARTRENRSPLGSTITS
jgi:hypothetical protein